MRLKILLEASQDVIEASLWYWTQGPGLDLRFENALDRKLEHLLAFPESAPLTFGEYRCIPMGDFPYLIVYRCTRDALMVRAVWQASRDPGNLLFRLANPDDEWVAYHPLT